jgi:hypothetical protein
MKKLFVSGLVALVSMGIAAGASAQDASATASYGDVSLNAGFVPDPTTVAVTSGGSIQASMTGCTGFIASAPDVELTYTAGSFPLNIYVKSGADTTLVINGPDGSWYCNDDSSGFNPLVSFPSPASGVYDIWVGAYSADGGAAAELNISEVAPQW